MERLSTTVLALPTYLLMRRNEPVANGALHAARLLAQSEIAQAYFQLRALDSEGAILRRAAATDDETLRLLLGRRADGLEGQGAVERARAELGGVRAEVLILQRARAAQEHGLAILLGRSPGEFRLEPAPLPPAPPNLLARTDVELETTRADLIAAERASRAAALRVGAAKRAWLPGLQRSASGGYAAGDVAQLIAASAGTFGIQALFALPIFDGGRYKAAIMAAKADARLAEAQRRGQVLAAYREVQDQASALTLLSEQAEISRATLAADEQATQLAQGRFTDGLASRLELLDARRTELRDRRAAAQVLAVRYATTIAFARAVGGAGLKPAVSPAAEDAR